MPEATFRGHTLEAIVFDLDGTLYRQSPLRLAMLARLLLTYACRPVAGWRTLSILRAYRRAQERLRGDVSGHVATAQLRHAAERTGYTYGTVARCVQRWIEQEPLALLPRCIRPGLVEFLESCRARGLRLGVLSDYPPEEKLHALGIDHFFDVIVSAQSPEVGVFKPDPKGLLLAIDRLGATPVRTIYVGDRADVDFPTAAAAGATCALISAKSGRQSDALRVRTFSELANSVFTNQIEATAIPSKGAQL